jgi:hypothetical protein
LFSRDPSQPLNPGSADQAVQHGLGLVVGGVRGCDPGCADPGGHFGEERVANPARGGFEVPPGGQR